MMRDSVVITVGVVCTTTHPRAIPLAMITMRKSTHVFPFLSYMSMGLLRLAANSVFFDYRKVGQEPLLFNFRLGHSTNVVLCLKSCNYLAVQLLIRCPGTL